MRSNWDHKGYQLSIKSWYGRLGNNLLQLCCAIFIAKKTKSVLRYPRHSFIKNKVLDFREPNQNNCNKTICDIFFGHDMLKNLKPDYTELSQIDISRNYIRPLLDVQSDTKWNPLSPKKDFDDTLVVHIRSGDSMKNGVNKNYVQPPFACYKKALIDSGIKFACVLIVTEKDFRNPTINALKTFCKQNGYSCYVQQGSLVEDVSTILRARYFVTSQSSFAWTLLRCNTDCKVAFIPHIRFPNDSVLPNTTENLPYEQHIYGLPDYICAKQWMYTQKQLKLMVEYPSQKIVTNIVTKKKL